MVKKSKEINFQSGQSISLDYLTTGSGNPKTLIISGIHGNEKTGQIIINKLIERLPSFPGSLTLLPVANPTGFAKNIREEAFSGLDLNRNFFETVEDTHVAKITTAIGVFAKEHDYVIDLHNFKTDGLIQVVSNHIGRSDELAMLFRPDIVRTSGKNKSLKKSGTLNTYLKENNISYVLLELPIHTKVSEEKIDRVVSGLLTHLANPGEYKNNSYLSELPKVGIRVLKAEMPGKFIKNTDMALSCEVSEGALLGEIVLGTSHHEIRSPYAGIICEIDPDETRTVVVGDTLIGIGEQ